MATVFHIIFNQQDVAIFYWINGLASSVFDPFVIFVGGLGGQFLWAILCLLLFIFGKDKNHRWIALTLAATFALTYSIVFIIKTIIYFPRPYTVLVNVNLLVQQSQLPLDSTFPSGHTAVAFSTAVVAGSRFRRFRTLVFLLAFGTAFSMVYVGVHFPSDCFAGAFLGMGVGLFMNKLSEHFEPF
jgi:undecaprenyl-diphosphatase